MALPTSNRITLWTLEEEGADPEYFGKVDIGQALTLEALRTTLEKNEILEWPFEFWDAEDKRRIRKKLERLNNICPEVYAIRLDGGDNDFNKRRRLLDGCFVPTSVECSPVTEVEVESLDPAVQFVGSSRVSGLEDSSEVEEIPLKSTLLPNEVMDQYLERAKKLRAELKRVALSDHDWWLKSFDLNGSGVVKLWCGECKKDCGGGSNNHTKAHIDNLFNNFRRSHIVSAAHVRNFCAAKNVDFEEHPQSQQKNGRPIILTPEDHKRMIAEGVEIVQSVNGTLPDGHKEFTVLGNLQAEDTRCYWFKVRCQYCRDVMVLCPVKKNLEVNLLNHISGPKHKKAVEDAGRIQRDPARTGRPGRPSTSNRTSCHSNQADLHTWLSRGTSSNIEGISQTFDSNLLAAAMCYGFRGPSVEYGGNSYEVIALLNDPHSGVEWYPEPHLVATVQVGIDVVQVSGSFRSRKCRRVSMSLQPFTNLTCPACAQIPRENDFRMRIWREDHALVKRGHRSTAGGIRLGYLSVHEVSKHMREMSTKYRIEKLHHCHARMRIVQLKVKRPTLRESAKNASSDNNLMKFCNNIISAHRIGSFGGKAALWDFMKDVASNLNRDGRGNRYSENTKCFSQAMRVYGGRRLCDLFALNFAGPSYETIRRECRKGIQFIAGEHAEIFESIATIYADAKATHGIIGSVPVILAEDETKVRGRVAWEARSDTVVGFCGPKADHVCIPLYKPSVGAGEGGYNKLVESFKLDKVGGFARVIVVNPLHEKLPRLVLVAICTCGCFDSNWVRQQWDRIDELWKKHCYSAVGPIIGHASDGDSRRRQLMLQDFRSKDGLRLSVDWEGWVFTSALNVQGEATGLHDQDYIHNGKKLLNPIDSNVRTLKLGGDLALHQHICQVFNRFTFDEHGLLQQDYDRKDRQNWASAQRLCSQKVRDCLRSLRLSTDVHRERTLGTEMYLEICADYIDMFLSPRHDLRARMVKAAKVSFFFRIWKLWITHGNHGVMGNTEPINPKVDFVSQQCFLDIQLSCHFFVLLVCHFRDKYPHLTVPFHLTGSDSCEIFFSKVGGMVGLERSYDFHELLGCANTVNHLSQIEYGGNGIKFGRAHNKMNNIWGKLHPLQPDEVEPDLGDYTAVSTNDHVISALKEGLKDAQRMINSLNMAPNSQASTKQKLWFEKPWLVEQADKLSWTFAASAKPVRGEDGDMEVLREDLIEEDQELQRQAEASELELVDTEEDILDDGVPAVTVAESEIRDVISEMLGNHEDQLQAIPVPVKVEAFVEFDGHKIFKSTLVGQLNGNPFLSKDRLTRVKNSLYFNNSDAYLSAAQCESTCFVGIGSDVGVFFVQRSTITRPSTVTAAKRRGKSRASKSGTATSVLQGVDQGTWWVGRIQKMRRRASGRSWCSLKQPVDLANRDVVTGRNPNPSSNIQVMLHYYTRAAGQYKFRYDLTDSKWIGLESIITNVTLTYNPENHVYSLEHLDAANLEDYVSKSVV